MRHQGIKAIAEKASESTGLPPVRSFHDLIAWQRAFDLGCAAYLITRGFPAHERFALTIQIRRCAVSIACNIAEGYGRGSTADYVRFLKIARGSAYELETHLRFALRFGYLTEQSFRKLKEMIDEAERVLAGLLRSIENNRS